MPIRPCTAPRRAQPDIHLHSDRLSVGQSRAKIDEQRITASLLGAGLATPSISSQEHDSVFKLFGGYSKVNRLRSSENLDLFIRGSF